MKLLVFITAYNVEKFINNVVKRIPLKKLKKKYKYISILIIDDFSKNNLKNYIDFFNYLIKNHINLKIIRNKKNLGYGGCQIKAYSYGIKNKFDHIVLLHGDGQYKPEKIVDMLNPLRQFDVVQGSRMIYKLDAIKGGMPLYKFFGNIFLTFFQNILTKNKLTEYHSGYRAYSLKALKSIPFKLNVSEYHFDTQILFQLMIANKKITEIAIPTYYGDEVSYLNSISYGFKILKTTIDYKFRDNSFFYKENYDLKNFSL
jgi:hypothetical protein